ncbi:hypothetical protein BC835DRAFT_1404423 [Cytidiella melzeri]|nr:hypothetical protein BC835DRAFT_1404423 [Cytidiella melzeri]
MPKSKKQPTAQELYWARKQREEDEKNAHLPPGLINHGNTCFMNSTLQGLIATPLLHKLVNFEDIPSSSSASTSTTIAARNSPQLTNGHGHGGEYEHEWEQGMPLGDVFVMLLQKAWGIQQNQSRQSMSPKEMLTTIGRKYDQYLDFRQQDAHEFLTHMLDAIRLEEVDMIKKRQPPPPPPPKGKRRRTRHSADSTPDEDKLVPFVDMIFGGKLASILVCDACKKISVTHEDFHDLSLSIKPEDYIKERKRDRFRGIAKKLRLIPKAHTSRASSVPASPARSTLQLVPDHADAPVEVETRRRSLEDTAGDSDRDRNTSGDSAGPVVDLDAKALSGDSDAPPKDGSPHVSFADPAAADGEKAHDAWGKLGRRINLSMSVSGRKEKRLSRSLSNSRSGSRERLPPNTNAPWVPISSPLLDGVGSASPNIPRTSSPLPLGTSPINSPTPSHTPGPFPNVRQLSGIGLGDLIKHSNPHSPKQPRPPKPTREESAYLRRVLADVNPSGSSTFSLIHQALSGNSPSATPLSAQALLVKLGHLPGIEECLRLFTAVEVLDGDNMVGCHRCWKIANGTYKPRNDKCDENSEDGDEDSQNDPILVDPEGVPWAPVTRVNTASSADSVNLPGYVTHASTPVISEVAETSSLFTPDSASVMSAPTTIESIPNGTAKPTSLPVNVGVAQPSQETATTPDAPLPSYGGFPIPSISTTGPDTPVTSPAVAARGEQQQEAARPAIISRDTLQPPIFRKHRAGKRSSEEEEDGVSAEESYDSESEDASGFSDVSSVASPVVSPSASPHASVERLPRASTPELENRSKVPRREQVILRRTFKRYLIAMPPPILIIHLKRFQQTSKSPYAMSFSSGFKKLDDSVAFPEYLDLAPYLAPKKEDYGLGRKKHKDKGEKELECVYRLYAVVVHIGNMLGGHYVSYTALPPTASGPQPSADGDSSPTETAPTYPEPQRQWAFISDTNVRLVSLEEVLKAKAYLCMYERI